MIICMSPTTLGGYGYWLYLYILSRVIWLQNRISILQLFQFGRSPINFDYLIGKISFSDILFVFLTELKSLLLLLCWDSWYSLCLHLWFTLGLLTNLHLLFHNAVVAHVSQSPKSQVCKALFFFNLMTARSLQIHQVNPQNPLFLWFSWRLLKD